MSKAIRCDRCSKCFDPYTIRCDFSTFGKLIVQDGKQYSNHEYGYCDEDMNLCPDCTMQFAGWMSRRYDFVERKEEKKDEKPENSGDTDGDEACSDIVDLCRSVDELLHKLFREE